MIVDLEKVAGIIAEIAAEEIMPRYGKLSDQDISTKSSPSDFVTQADIAAEARLAIALGEIYPGAAFIGEECASKDASLGDSLSDEGAFWIVDPLDGTRNFVQGREEFGSIVALVADGEIRAGWIYAIPDNAFAMAERGEGVTWRGLSVSPEKTEGDELKGYRSIGNLAEPWKTQLVPELRANLITEPARCSAYAYINLVRSKRDFALYSRVHPWDHAAGVLMLNELGGRVEYLDDGSAYLPRATQGRPLLVAGSEDRWLSVKAKLLG